MAGRPRGLAHRRRRPVWCSHCGQVEAHAAGLCITDYQYRRRTGRLRPAELVARQARLNERQA